MSTINWNNISEVETCKKQLTDAYYALSEAKRKMGICAYKSEFSDIVKNIDEAQDEISNQLEKIVDFLLNNETTTN